ncbi:MAG: helix-turn-helix transcriptional regulator [Bacteroidales bacterium]|nr:helix-turn-helix transcriptional regulator [Bacteroidales bacterium]
MKYKILIICVLMALVGCTGSPKTDQWPEWVVQADKDYKQAVDYDGQWQVRLAEMYYRKAYEALKKANEDGLFPPADDQSYSWFLYGDAGYRYAVMLYRRGDTEGAIGLMSDILAHDIRDVERSSILQLMGECQLLLEQHDAARESYTKAFEVRSRWQQDGKDDCPINMMVTCFAIYNSFMEFGEYEEAAQWLERMEKELSVYEQKTDASPRIIEEYRGYVAMNRARLLLATGHAHEANAVYDAIPASRIFTPLGITWAAIWLSDAGRYGESADMYARLDTTYASASNATMTFDKINECLAPRYLAEMKAGRTQEALAIGADMANAIDSALVWQKRNDAAELSVIYQTHEKELALEESRTKSTIYLIIAVGALLLLLLVGYILWLVRRDNRLLTEKNRVLYEQIQQREQAETEERERQQAQPTESLSQSQQIYRRLCELLEDPAIYTDAECNHETLAQLLGTNRTYLYDALRECADTTPADFINRYRIRHAALLLATTDNPVALVAELCGITNRSTFARLFRDHYSMSPTEYRHAAKEK